MQLKDYCSVLFISILGFACGKPSQDRVGQSSDLGDRPRNRMHHVTFLRDEPGQENLQTHDQSGVSVPDSALILGVVADGRPRAYLASGMAEPEWHLAHDTLGSKQVTVTYCDWNQCARAFERGTNAPAAIRMGGVKSGVMQIKLNEKNYDQTNPQIPLLDLTVVQMTWGEWKTLHPTTDIYLGNKEEKFALEGKSLPNGGR